MKLYQVFCNKRSNKKLTANYANYYLQNLATMLKAALFLTPKYNTTPLRFCVDCFCKYQDVVSPTIYKKRSFVLLFLRALASLRPVNYWMMEIIKNVRLFFSAYTLRPPRLRVKFLVRIILTWKIRMPPRLEVSKWAKTESKSYFQNDSSETKWKNKKAFILLFLRDFEPLRQGFMNYPG